MSLTLILIPLVLSFLTLIKYCLVVDMRPEDLVELKKTLPHKRKARTANTSSKKMRSKDKGPVEASTK